MSTPESSTAGPPRLPWRTRVALGVGRPVTLALMWCFYRLRRQGGERIPRRGPVLMVSNHQSHLDPIILGLISWGRAFRPIARQTLYRSKPMAWLLHAFDTIPIDQEKSDTAAIKAAINELRKGQMIMIYPEGSRTPDGVTHEFQRGFLVLLKRAKAPIVPVAIEGAHDVWPIGQRFPRFTGRVAARALEPVSYERIERSDPSEVMEELRRRIESARLELRKEIAERSNGAYPRRPGGEKPYWETESTSDAPPTG